MAKSLNGGAVCARADGVEDRTEDRCAERVRIRGAVKEGHLRIREGSHRHAPPEVGLQAQHELPQMQGERRAPGEKPANAVTVIVFAHAESVAEGVPTL